MIFINFFFFFQAEDGIRDYKVTGVQTCALPILPRNARGDGPVRGARTDVRAWAKVVAAVSPPRTSVTRARAVYCNPMRRRRSRNPGAARGRRADGGQVTLRSRLGH